MIIRSAVDADDAELKSFDTEASTVWEREADEVVAGLLRWRSEPQAGPQDRRVIVAIEHNAIVAVTAHLCLVRSDGRIRLSDRYLLVTAVHPAHRRAGIARTLIESVIADLHSSGCQSVEWLVHPHNRPSIEFSRRVFPEADETQPPEDKPYVSFALTL